MGVTTAVPLKCIGKRGRKTHQGPLPSLMVGSENEKQGVLAKGQETCSETVVLFEFQRFVHNSVLWMYMGRTKGHTHWVNCV